MIPIGAIAGAGFGLYNAISAGKDKRRARRDAAAAQAEMNKQRAAYENLDISNPFANMTNQFTGLENTMEDLTVNQQQAQFEAQQGQQQRANIMANMSQAAGGSGIAALAQQMAQSGQLQAQQASASIGAQEAANQRLSRQEASRLQTLERRGEITSRQQQRNQVGTLLGMRQSEAAAAREQRSNAQAARQESIGGAVGGLFDLAGTAATSGVFGGGGSNRVDVGGGITHTQEQLDVMSEYGFNPSGG